MIALTVLAKVYWRTQDEGGRSVLPVGAFYAPIIKTDSPCFETFEDGEYWSAFVKITEILEENVTMAEIRYLSELAPNKLKKGVTFRIYEGKKIVATGTVIADNIGEQ